MEIFRLSVSEAFKRLNSCPEGLSFREARQRLEDFGPNALHEERSRSPLWLLGRQFTHFFALLLGVGAGLAFIGEAVRPGEGMGTLGWAILGVVVINAVFAFWEEYRAEKAVQSLKKLLPNRVRVRREGRVVEMDAVDVVPGDILLLEEGDKVSADGRVLISNLLAVNNAALTGESSPLSREVDDPEAASLLRAKNMVFAGTLVVSGNGEVLVTATGINTEFGKIAKLTEHIEQDLSPLQKEIVKVSRWISILALTMGAIFFLIGIAMGRDTFSTVLFALGIIVANIPEGLLPTVTLALSMASFRMAKRNALIKDLNSVATLGSTTVICTDKTGTLTQNRMTVQKIFCNSQVLELNGEGVGEWEGWSSEQTRAALNRLLKAAALNTRATLKGEEVVGDPTEGALLQAFMRWSDVSLGDVGDREKIRELPFSGERKRMSTLYREAEGITLYTKGAPEVLLERSTRIWSDGGVRFLSDTDREKIRQAVQAFAQEALRVLAIAYRSLEPELLIDLDQDLEQGLIFLGFVGMIDPPREGVVEAINQCHRAGIRVIMVTGDNPATGMAIGRRIGLEESGKPLVPIHSDDMAQMSDDSLKEVLRDQNPLFARLTSQDKLRIVSLLKELGEVVAVTGDGVNDAPALKRLTLALPWG